MDFTNEEKERINQLYGNDFKDIKPEDAELIGRWEAWKAVNASEHQAKIEAIKAQADQKLEQNKAEFDKAMENLNSLHDIALKRFEVMK